MCNHYFEQLSLLQNILESIKRSDFRTSKNITLCNVDFSLGKGVKLSLPANITLKNCALVSGSVYFHHGELVATTADAMAFACGNDAVAIAAAPGAIAFANVKGAIARAITAKANAYAQSNGAKAYADKAGASSHAAAPWAAAYATDSNTDAFAYTPHSAAHADACNARAYAISPESDAHANTSGASSYARRPQSCAYAHAAGSNAHADVKDAISQALEEDANAFSSANGARSYAREKGARAYATESGATSHATVAGAMSIATHINASSFATTDLAFAITVEEWTNYLQWEEEQEVQEWNDYVDTVVIANETQHKNHYKKAGGLYDFFIESAPSAQHIADIHFFIHNHYDTLKKDGVKRGGMTLFLPEGVDCIMREQYHFHEQMEWCLLHQGGKHYNFIQMTTAHDLIESGSQHPFLIGHPLAKGDIHRGSEVVAIINSPSCQ